MKPTLESLLKPGGLERLEKKWSKPMSKREAKRLAKRLNKIQEDHEAFMREQARLWHENKYKIIFTI